MKKEKNKACVHDEECNCQHGNEHINKEECNCQNDDICTCGDNCKCNEEVSKKDKKHLDKLNEAYNKISALEDSLLRSKADFVNYRKRLEEEQSRLLKYCNEDLVKDLLIILDSFDRAISMQIDETNEEMVDFLSGFKMIYCNLINILNKYEVIEIDGNNKPFDPTYHQAVVTEEKMGIEPGMVLEVLQKGYILKGKVIRPAMVKVSK